MKKFVIAAVAAALVSTSAYAAPSQGPDHRGPAQSHSAKGPVQPAPQHKVQQQKTPQYKAPQYKAPQRKAHNWKRGERFEVRKATNYRVINNPRAHRLQAAPKGYRWVQSGRDAVLIRVSNNIIAQVVANAIR